MLRNVYRGKRVFVTGHTGFKGSWLCQWLLELGAEVTGYSNAIPTSPSHFERAKLAGHIQDLRGDIRDGDSLLTAMRDTRPEIVFHLAAQALVRDSYDEPKLTFDTNIGGGVNVLEAVRTLDSIEAAVIVATDKCYENREWEYGYRETDPLGGKDPYSASKGAAEIVFHSYVRSFFVDGKKRIGSARAGNVIGGHDWSKDRIIPDCMRAWTEKKSVTIRNPEAIRPWQHVLEPLSGYLALGAALYEKDSPVVGESFNFGPGPDANKTVAELLAQVSQHWPQAKWNVDQSQVGHRKEAKLLALSCDKARARLGWQPTLSFAESVQMTVEGYLADGSPASSQIARYVALAKERGMGWVQD